MQGRTAVPALAAMLAAAPASADVTCEWRLAPLCLEAGQPPALLPSNTVRLSQDALALCPAAWNPRPPTLNVVFLMDNSGSMERGENYGSFDTPPGDPFGIRDRVIRTAVRGLRGMAGTATAGFLSFYGLSGNQDYRVEPEIETIKLQRPLDISRNAPDGEANLAVLLGKIWKHNPNEALLQKRTAAAGGPPPLAKGALTFWSESLELTRKWFSPESGFVKPGEQAVVMVSDGAIGDWREVENLVSALPPVHGIHLGPDANSTHLKDLCTLTGGSYHIVSPVDTMAFHRAIQAILRTLAGAGMPESIHVTRTSGASGPGSSLTAEPWKVDADGNLILRTGTPMDLTPGLNVIRVALAEGEAALMADAAGPVRTESDTHFACMDPAGIHPAHRARSAPVGSGGYRDARDALGRKRETARGWRGVPLFEAFPR